MSNSDQNKTKHPFWLYLGFIHSVIYLIMIFIYGSLFLMTAEDGSTDTGVGYLIPALGALFVFLAGNLTYYLLGRNEIIYGNILSSPYYVLIIYVFYSFIKYGSLVLPSF